jgi:regulator of protease activity HflC (stomatin/prohibitin superfamily)
LFDRLFEVLQWVGEALLPFVVLQPYEAAVLVRLGRFKRVLAGGFHWLAPFHIDVVWHDHITPTTHHLAGLSTTTKDGRSIGFDAIVTYKISDIEKALLNVTDVKDAVVDTCMGIIGTALSDATWEDILHGRMTDELTKLCRARGWRWGIEVMSVQLAGVALVKNIRLSGMQHEHSMQIGTG